MKTKDHRPKCGNAKCKERIHPLDYIRGQILCDKCQSHFRAVMAAHGINLAKP